MTDKRASTYVGAWRSKKLYEEFLIMTYLEITKSFPCNALYDTKDYYMQLYKNRK